MWFPHVVVSCFCTVCLMRLTCSKTGSTISTAFATMASCGFSILLTHLLICLTYGRTDENKPEQIHIAFTGNASERNVNYVTPSPSEKPESVVMYGTSQDKLDKKAVGDSFVFTGPGHSFTIHNVKV